MKSLHVKKGDRVKVISGKEADKGKIAEILSVDVERQRVVVEGVNIVKRHRKDSANGQGQQVKGGIISSEAPIHVSNVMILDSDGKPTRVGYRFDEDGKKVRVAVKTGDVING